MNATWDQFDDETARETARLASLATELTALRRRVEGELGEADVAHIRALQRFSRASEVVGRLLIHFSFEPVSFAAGVGALWVHKQLQTTEIGHTCLHGAYDRFPELSEFHADGYRWDTPIDEAAWHVGHNLKHHGFTNVAGKDPDIHFGPVRLTEHTPHRARHRHQLLYSLVGLFPSFTWTMNWHFSGLNDVYFGNGLDQDLDFLPDRSWDAIVGAHRTAFRKYVPYFLKEFVFFPALAGPFFWKVALGNYLAGALRDAYTAATIFCGHVGEDVAAYPEGTRAGSKGRWYEMQVQSAHNFEVPELISVLYGGLDLQIEHHLFPRLTPRRLRQIAPEVRQICEAHGVTYRTGSWPQVLGKALRRVAQLARPDTAKQRANGPRQHVEVAA